MIENSMSQYLTRMGRWWYSWIFTVGTYPWPQYRIVRDSLKGHTEKMGWTTPKQHRLDEVEAHQSDFLSWLRAKLFFITLVHLTTFTHKTRYLSVSVVDRLYPRVRWEISFYCNVENTDDNARDMSERETYLLKPILFYLWPESF